MGYVRRDVFQDFQPFPAHREFVVGEARDIAARMRKARNQTDGFLNLCAAGNLSPYCWRELSVRGKTRYG
jgi:hypothetical protein